MNPPFPVQSIVELYQFLCPDERKDNYHYGIENIYHKCICNDNVLANN